MERRRAGRRLFWIALGLSAAIHLLVFVLPWGPVTSDTNLVPLGPSPDDVVSGFEVVVVVPPPPESEVIEVVEPVVVPEEEDPDPPQEDPVVEVVAPPVAAPPTEPDSVAAETPPPTTGDRSAAQALMDLRYDERLNRPLPPELRDLSNDQLFQIALIMSLRDYNEAAAAEEERLRALTDWSYTDDDGKRWGVSPGEIHLGDFSIPLPLFFQSSPLQRAEYQRRALDLADLNYAAELAESAQMRQQLYDQMMERRRRNQAARDTTGRGGR